MTPDILPCPNCDRSVRRTARWCPECGYRIGIRTIVTRMAGEEKTLRVREAVPPGRADELEDSDEPETRMPLAGDDPSPISE